MDSKYNIIFILILITSSLFLIACNNSDLSGQAIEQLDPNMDEESTIQKGFECIDQDETSNTIFKDQSYIEQDPSIFINSLTYLDNGNNLTYYLQEDSCINSTHLREYYCKKNKIKSKIIRCPGANFCTQGSCKDSCPLIPTIPPDQESPPTSLTGQGAQGAINSFSCNIQDIFATLEGYTEDATFQQRLDVFNKLLSERITQGDLPRSGNILYIDPKEYVATEESQGLGIYSTGGYNGDPMSTGDDIVVSKQRLMYFLKYTSSSGPYADNGGTYSLAESTINSKTPIRTAEIGFGWGSGTRKTPTGFFKLIDPIIASNLYSPTIRNPEISSARLILTNLDTPYQETSGANNPSERAILIHGTGSSQSTEQQDDGSLGCVHLLAQEITNLATNIRDKNQEYYIFISGQEDFGDLPAHDKALLCKFYEYGYCTENSPTQRTQTLATPISPDLGIFSLLGIPTSGLKEQAIDIALPIIKHFEGFDEKDDNPGDGVCHGYECSAHKPTIGYGHLIVEGEDWSNGVTEPQAAILLKNELMNNYYPSTIRNLENRGVDVDLLEVYQIAAAVIFQYNLGPGVIGNPGLSTWPSKLQPYDEQSAEISWKAFYKAQTIKDSDILCPLAGLMRRRFVEWQLFSTGTWEENPEGWQETYNAAKAVSNSQCTD